MSGSMLVVQSRQAGGCHPVPRERHPLKAGTKVVGPQGLPISILVCVFNTGLNGKDKSQQPDLFLGQEVLLLQLLMLLLTYVYICLYIHRNEYNVVVCFGIVADSGIFFPKVGDMGFTEHFDI